MHGAAFHKYNKQRKYLPLWLRGEDVHSICSLTLQLKIDYAVKRLTVLPVEESDIRFTWVQVSGAPPLEFSDYHAAQPFIVLNPEITEDLHFKVYIDKDEPTELVSDVWVYRTPTEKTLQYVEQIKGGRVQGLTVDTENPDSVPSNIKALFPQEVSVIENLRNGVALTQDDILSFQVIASRVEPSSRLIGLEVLSFQVYDVETGGLVGLNRNGELTAVIPKDISTFYLKIEISVYNGIGNLNPRIYTITSNKVYSTPIRNFETNLGLIRLYAQEGTETTISGYYKGTYGEFSKTVSLPANLSMFEQPSRMKMDNGIGGSNVTSKKLKPRGISTEETLSPNSTDLILEQNVRLNRHIIRYNGITIGG